MVKSFQTPLVLRLAVGYSLAVMKWLWWVHFLTTYPASIGFSWSCALYWGECFLELCTYSGVDGHWHSSGVLQFHWYYFIEGLQVYVQNSISDLLKGEVTVQAWLAQEGLENTVKYWQHFQNVFLNKLLLCVADPFTCISALLTSFLFASLCRNLCTVISTG